MRVTMYGSARSKAHGGSKLQASKVLSFLTQFDL
jgi:hypothetical protein